jgi:peptide-methionine (R)-S-oxide reductase
MTHNITRRRLGLGAAAAAFSSALSACTKGSINANAKIPTFKETNVSDASQINWANLSESDWKDRLTAEEFNVLRREGTERPWTSPLNDEKRDGVFVCKGCELPLFTSDTKYDSRTGWPSFFDVIEGNISTKVDKKLFLPRTEYHCARCGGHQGHVFTDGPRPTGLRYCNNGVAISFVPKEA